MIYVQSQATFLTTTTFYILLSIFILTKCINCFVLDTNAYSMPSSQSHQLRHQQYVNASTGMNDAHATDIAPNSEEYTPSEGRELDIETGRKKTIYKGGKFGKTGKNKKFSKLMYPVLIGLFITKMIMFPLFVKAVTILSSASFVFSKMSLLASLILGLKFFLTNNHQQGENKVEIVHVPMKKFGNNDWDRETAENKVHASVITDHGYEHEQYRPSPYRK